MFDSMVQQSPMREAVRYGAKNIKWSASEVKKNTDAHANALLEHGFIAGETIAIWHKECAEKHISLLAAARIGLKIVDIDVSISSVTDLREALKLAKCKAIIFEPQTETHDNLLLLRKAIPEFFSFDDTFGQQFHSKYFPTLEYFIHTGYDLELGCLNYKSLFLPHPEVDEASLVAAKLTNDMPLYMKIMKGPSGVECTKEVTHSQVLEQTEWDFAKKLVNKEYFEF
eukprot:CAMPEP_0182428618 /NCGR_PEP_ID=MMETSP1167-20130531/23153_1 /TAXON_ID=2988 /ORGANISM="Mallomonas Sp, Strain CCMP3275" /LENGTH=226 /DNA_ID=CAMNT_0024611609 /DNA_START=138 /DNA_END=818 /DNA_ORIENTATION=-